MVWTAELTNNPERDFELYLELLEDGEYRARLQRSPAGQLDILFYGGAKCLIPWKWLSEVAERFIAETQET